MQFLHKNELSDRSEGSWVQIPHEIKIFFRLFFYIFCAQSMLYEIIKRSHNRVFFDIQHIFLIRSKRKFKSSISNNIFGRFQFFWSLQLQYTSKMTKSCIIGSSTFFCSFLPSFGGVFQFGFIVVSFWLKPRTLCVANRHTTTEPPGDRYVLAFFESKKIHQKQ